MACFLLMIFLGLGGMVVFFSVFILVALVRCIFFTAVLLEIVG